MIAQSKFVKIVSFNIDTNFNRLENGVLAKVFQKWTVAQRIAYILLYLGESNADIICIQELRKCVKDSGEQLDSVTPLVKELNIMGYEVLLHSYNPYGKRAFKYLTAYKPALFSIVEEKMLVFTKTGEFISPEQRAAMDDGQIKDHNFGAFFARGALVVTFEDCNGRVFQVINVHIDIPWTTRRESSRIIAEHFSRSVVPVICVGDCNSFPDWNGEEQCETIKTVGMCSNALEHYTSSFIAFPYDFGKNDARLRKNGVVRALEEIKNEDEIKPAYLEVYEKECDALGGRLDNVFHKGFANVTASIKLTPIVHNRVVPFEEAAVKAYVLECAALDMPAFASDHQLIEVSVEF